MLVPPFPDEETVVTGVGCRMILNTHLEWIPEFTVRLADGRTGQGAAPRADTPSMYETGAAGSPGEAQCVVAEAQRVLSGRAFGQTSVDVAETDIDGWAAFHAVRPPRCGLLSDNFTSTSPVQLAAKATHVDGVLLKPDQIGSLTGAHRFASLAREFGLPLIASARSVETGSPLISHVAAAWDLDYLKVGPYQDFSSVMQTNELLRGRVLWSQAECGRSPPCGTR